MQSPHVFGLIIAGLSILPIAARATPAQPEKTPVEAITIAAADAQVRYTGRRLEEGESVRLTFPGTEIRVRFKGASIALRGEVTSGANWFNRRVDGGPQPRVDLESGAFQVALAQGLVATAEHEIRLVRRNEAWQGTVRLDAFILPEGGEILAPPARRVRRIMALGDSITCGQSAEFIPPFAPKSNSTANAELTYAWELAHRFGADLHLVSYGGRGIIRDWQGNREAFRAIDIFERADADQNDPAWDHARFAPDLVTICFGTNDFAKGMLPLDEFANAYRVLVERVHTVHPEAKILLLSSPMLPGYAPDRADAVIAALREVEASIRAEGGDFVRVYPFGDYSGTEWDAHPIAPQHRAMADELEPIIREWLDWDVMTE